MPFVYIFQLTADNFIAISANYDMNEIIISVIKSATKNLWTKCRVFKANHSGSSTWLGFHEGESRPPQG